MPNHVTSVITLSGDESRIKAMLEQIKNDEVGIGSVDFNKILPMPESLHMTSGSIEDSAIAVYISAINPINEEFEGVKKKDAAEFREMLKKLPVLSQKIDILMPENEAINLAEDRYRESVKYLVDKGEKYVSNLIQYGASTWFDWAVGNWGTKWNAYGYDNGVEMEDGKLKFLTAWAAPHPIMQKLSEMYPDIKFEHEWADEDNVIDVNCMAKLCADHGIRIGRNRLFAWMRSRGILMGGNIPYQEYIENGYFRVKESVYETNGQKRTYQQTFVTGKGQQYILSRLMRE